jgi:hypothetical protein
MKIRLGDEDRRAIDLLLDQRTDGVLNEVFAVTAQDNLEKRLASVEKVLALLEQMPAAEPPADLVMRTMNRIDGATFEQSAATHRMAHPLLGDPRPHA